MTARTFVATALLFVALPALAATLVNINTADVATLETLSGIGPSKAQAIIDYRTQHGPFATIADIMNVSGIGTATYNNIKDFITVSDSSAASQDTTQTQTTTAVSSPTTTQVVVQSGSGSTLPQISAQITTDAEAVVGAGTMFEGQAFDASGKPLMGVRYVWNFGDGTAGEGSYVVHTYRYPGTYDVGLSVAYNYSSASARLLLPAIAAQVALVAEGDGSLTIENEATTDLDIGLWSLRQGTSTYVVPESTILLRDKGIRFAPEVLEFNGGTAAQLYYPNGSVASGARVGSASPLRGQVVELSGVPAKQPSSSLTAANRTALRSSDGSSPTPTSPVNGGDQVAAAASGADPAGQWPYLLGLTGVIALGALGAYYAHVPRPRSETELTAEEFDIE